MAGRSPGDCVGSVISPRGDMMNALNREGKAKQAPADAPDGEDTGGGSLQVRAALNQNTHTHCVSRSLYPSAHNPAGLGPIGLLGPCTGHKAVRAAQADDAPEGDQREGESRAGMRSLPGSLAPGFAPFGLLRPATASRLSLWVGGVAHIESHDRITTKTHPDARSGRGGNPSVRRLTTLQRLGPGNRCRPRREPSHSGRRANARWRRLAIACHSRLTRARFCLYQTPSPPGWSSMVRRMLCAHSSAR